MPVLRQGRKQPQNVYLQLGDEPSDEDPYLGVFFDPVKALLIIQMANGERPPLSVMTLPWPPPP